MQQHNKARAIRVLACGAVALALAPQPAFAKKKMSASESLKPLTVEMPTNNDVFPDRPGAETLDRNCLGCHSAETVMNQPALPKAAWEAEIEKMRTAYKAPINPEDVDGIVTYLVGTNGIARSKWR
ncbi:MAG: sulfite:cytochrome oxidoreductase subunit bprecursor [Rhodospirillales bacterium]|nr:sulfite:cytochrome oxidoreductase subunit bprecursor [Rhodospirillales bacterium]